MGDLKKRVYAVVDRSLSFVIYGAVAYLIVASVVFRFRHTWMTDTECIVHTIDALTLEIAEWVKKNRPEEPKEEK